MCGGSPRLGFRPVTLPREEIDVEVVYDIHVPDSTFFVFWVEEMRSKFTVMSMANSSNRSIIY